MTKIDISDKIDDKEVIKGILFGSFDIWHAGYSLMCQDAKEECDFLIVGLQAENKKKPIVNTIHERFLVLKSIRHIDEICIYSTEQELVNLLQFYKPNKRFLGSDYKCPIKMKQVTGIEYSGRIVYLNRNHGYSTTNIKQKIEALYR